LWSFAQKKNGKLLWCLVPKYGFNESHFNQSVPVAVQGDTNKPFVLVSFPSPEPNLHAVGLNENVTVTQVGCMMHILKIRELSTVKNISGPGPKLFQDVANKLLRNNQEERY